ncbi:hypothetical protein ISF_00518 [Cordyceps fumosorosea ARSEF 2679]|uniref:Uncharacterized protein n=1 Tax=Cordyceps fumosorosea (strain ARSEF 2679) TaxID=1081104 RepID=A0A168EBN2_CORFA|nr:hypothetical protein ISF_00518 [Cordyceps fumosorosea ARSEF 2679]OAA73617.1 hypothetical protein ISF_00518 [Cordyceps fumosorosea ARSEF 2679]
MDATDILDDAPPTAICPHRTAILLRMPDRWTHPMFLKLQRVLYDDDFDRNGVARTRRQHELVRSLVPADRLLEHRVGDGWAQRSTPGRAATSVGCAACSARSSRRVLDLAAYAALAWVVLSQVPASLW